MLTSAQATDQATSGAIFTEVRQEAPGFGPVTVSIEQFFDGDDSAMLFTTEGAGGFGQETIAVDGTIYERTPGGEWTAVPGGVEIPTIATAPEVAEFVAAAEEVEDCDVEGDGVTSYCITSQDLDAFNAVLPIDFEAADEVNNADVRLDVDVESGLITDVIGEAKAMALSGAEGTITATVSYEDLGQPQQIEAPSLG